MRLDKINGVILAVILLVPLFAVGASRDFQITGEFQIAVGESDQWWPAIGEDFVVWEDERNGNKDIYGYNLSTEEEFQITTDPHDQYWPAIYNNIVVWTDERNGNKDIYGYDLSTEEEFQITTDPHDQSDPAIYNNIVVWVDNRNGNYDIYRYNLLSRNEVQITTDPHDQEGPAVYNDVVVWYDNRNGNFDIYGYIVSESREFQITTDPHDQRGPVIYKDIVVWTDNRNGNQDIYGYDLSTGNEVQITTDPHDQEGPAIYENIVVWEDNRNGNFDIYGCRFPSEDVSQVVTELIEEFQITTDPRDQEGPAIYKDIVVWHDNRNGNQDIYGYNLSTGEEFQIMVDISNQKSPAIYNNIVIWVDNRNGNQDIYGYDLSIGEEFQITTDPRDQEGPAIYKDIVVWHDNRNGNRDIYGYDLSTGEEFQITSIRSDQNSPAIYNNIVVWTDNRNGNRDIYGYDLLTKKEFQITTDPYDQYWPAIYNNIVVWTDERNGNQDIYRYDLETKEEFQIIVSPRDQQYPAICKDTVVWMEYENDNFDIYRYDLSTKKAFQITTDLYDQMYPKVYGHIVVWTDDRNGNQDIYGYNLFASEEFQITTDPKDQFGSAISGDIVVWTDERNDSYDIYGCNLSTILDNDGDTFSPAVDCNDDNPHINPEAIEICDGNDNDCDGDTDEGFDNDKDGHTTCGGDCNDKNSAIHPGAEETCDKEDNNCIDGKDENNACGSVVIWINDDKQGGTKYRRGEEIVIYYKITSPASVPDDVTVSDATVIIEMDPPHGRTIELLDEDGITMDEEHSIKRYLVPELKGEAKLLISASFIVRGKIITLKDTHNFHIDGGIPPIFWLCLIGILSIAFLIVYQREFIRYQIFSSDFEHIHPNPYNAGGPVKSKDMFFGRGDVFRDIKNDFSAKDRNIAIILHGERRTGKTSILYQIMEGKLGDKFVPLYIDIQELAGVDDKEFCTRITEEIMESLLQSHTIDPKSKEYSEINTAIKRYKIEPNPYSVLTDFFKKVSKVLKERCLILMFDEYDRLDKKIISGDLSEDLIGYLRSQMHSRERVLFIFAGSRRIEELEIDEWSVMFNVAKPYEISFLEKEDAKELMRKPVDDKIMYYKKAENRLLRLTACHPYFLQLFLQSLVDYLNKVEKNFVTVKKINCVLEYILVNPPSHMADVWRRLKNEEKMVLSAISEIIKSESQYISIETVRKKLLEKDASLDEREIGRILDKLEKRAIIGRKKDKDAYNFRIDLFRYWTKNEHPLSRTMREIE